MTKEEKLQAYDEALKRVQPLYQQAKMDNNPIASTYEYLFPELAESEDERIRKWIIEEFKIHYDFESPSLNPMVVKAMIWLEKQKEQKLKEPDWCHHKVDLSGCSEEYMKAYYDGWNNCNQQHSQCEAEKKPIEWSEEDEEKYARVMQFLAQKRETFALAILQGICSNPEIHAKNPVDEAVKMADELLEKLYPIKEEESK